MSGLFNLTEGPEIRIIKNCLEKDILNKKIKGMKIAQNSKYYPNKIKNFDLFENASKEDLFTITNIDCKGRVFYWELQNKNTKLYFVSKPRMTGIWSKNKSKHWIMEVSVLSGETEDSVYFNDVRHYGWLEMHTELSFKKEIDKLGFDPLIDDLNKWFPYIYKKAKRSKNPIGKFLLLHEIFSGVGLYLRSEVLYNTKLYPYQQINTLTKAKLLEVCREVVKVANQSLRDYGCVDVTYDSNTIKANYLSKLKVFSKKTDPFGNKVIVTVGKSDKRSMFWCKDIQVKDE